MNQHKPFKTLIAAFTGFIFFVTSLGVNPNVFAAAATSEVSLPYQIKLDENLRIAIPQELGKLEHFKMGQGPTLFHIQTAHGHYEAQQQIRRILHHLEDNYGTKTILVEGSAFKLDPAILNFFPEDHKLTMKINEELTKHAIVKGPELYLLDQIKKQGSGNVSYAAGVQAFGIEQIDFYRENGYAFIDVLTQKEKTQGFLRDMNEGIERLSAPYLNDTLRAFLKREEAFEKNLTPMDAWLSYLKEQAQKNLKFDPANVVSQVEWPMLVRIFKIRELSSKLDRKAFLKEREGFLKALRRFMPGKEYGVRNTAQDPSNTPYASHRTPYQEIEQLLKSEQVSQQLPDPETSLLFEDMVKRLPKDFNYDAFPNVRYFIGTLLLQSELKASMLMSEVQKLTDQITAELARNRTEKELIKLLKGYRSLQKLFALKLSPQDYEAILGQRENAGRENIHPSEIVRRFGEIVPRSSFSVHRVKAVKFEHVDELDALYKKAMKFYEGVKARDGAMEQMIERRLKETGADKVVVITGGFHAEPFKDYFSSKDYTYALISPKITGSDKEGHEAYVRNMLDQTLKSVKSSTRESVSPASSPDQLRILGVDPGALAHAELRAAIHVIGKPAKAQEFALLLKKQAGVVTEPASARAVTEATPISLAARVQARARLSAPANKAPIRSEIRDIADLSSAEEHVSVPVQGVNKSSPGSQFALASVMAVTSYFVRSEMRDDVHTWVEANKPLVARSHVYSRQWECGLPMDFLKKVEELYGEYTAGRISMVTLTGGLGALMPDLFEAWAAIGMNVTGIHPLWNFIKNKPLKGADAKGIRELLGQIAKTLMEDTGTKFDVRLNVRGNFKTVSFKVYKIQSEVHKAPHYYLDAYTTGPDGRENPEFLEVYDDDPMSGKRVIDMAFFSAASERLVQILEDNKNPDNIILIDHEVFTSLPIRYLKKATRLTFNHSVFLPAIFEAWEGFYDLLAFPKRLWSTIVHDGMISIVDFVAETFHGITGVNLVEHRPALLKIFRTAWHHMKGFYDEAKQIRSTNGVFLPRWQSPARRVLIERYKEKLKIEKPQYKLPKNANDHAFFDQMETQEQEREQFEVQNEWVSAVDCAKLLIWLREKRGFKGSYDWLGNTFKDYRQQHQMDDGALVAHLNAMEKLLQKAVRDDLAEDWQRLETEFGQTRDLILADPILANLRRQVQYKGPDKYEEILKDLLNEVANEAGVETPSENGRVFNQLFQFWKKHQYEGDQDHDRFRREFVELREKLKDQPSVEKLRKTMARILIGGRTFSPEAHDQFLYIRFMTEFLGLEDRIATLEDHTYYEAQIVFRGVQGAVMLSDEGLEASATGMMKIMTNGGEIVGPFAGSNPEIWAIWDKGAKKYVPVLNKKGEPAITQNQLRDKLRNGEYENQNGIFVVYNDGEKSDWAGGGRRPSGRGILEALKEVKSLRSDPKTRRKRMYRSVADSWKVDMVTSQAMATASDLEEMLEERKKMEEMFFRVKFEASDYTVVTTVPTLTWGGLSAHQKRSAPGMGVLWTLKVFRELKPLRPWGGGPETRGQEALSSIKFHAYGDGQPRSRGDIFKYLLENVLKHMSAGVQPFREYIEQLAKDAETAKDEKERVILNLKAIELTEMLLEHMAGNWFERYMKANPEEAEQLRVELTQGAGTEYQLWTEYLSRYLEKHSDASPVNTHDNKIQSFVFRPQDGKPVLVNLNLGAPVKREEEQDFQGYKARTQVIIDEPTLYELVGRNSNVQSFKVREFKLGKDYSIHAKGNPVTVLGIGIPMPLGIEILELQPIPHTLLSGSVLEPVREQMDASPLKQLISQARVGYEISEGVPSSNHLFEQLEILANGTAGSYKVKPTMTLIGLFRPDLLNMPKVSSWHPAFHAKLSRAIADIQAVLGADTPRNGKHHFYVLESSHKSSLVLAEKNASGDVVVAVVQLAAADREFASDGKVSTQVLSSGFDQIIESGATYLIHDLLAGIDYEERNDLLQGWTLRIPFRADDDQVQLLLLKKKTTTARSEIRDFESIMQGYVDRIAQADGMEQIEEFWKYLRPYLRQKIIAVEQARDLPSLRDAFRHFNYSLHSTIATHQKQILKEVFGFDLSTLKWSGVAFVAGLGSIVSLNLFLMPIIGALGYWFLGGAVSVAVAAAGVVAYMAKWWFFGLRGVTAEGYPQVVLNEKYHSMILSLDYAFREASYDLLAQKDATFRSEMRPPFKGLYLFSGRQLSKYPVIQTAVRITKILHHSLAVFFEAFWKIFEIPFVIFLAVVGPVFYGVTAFLITSDTIETAMTTGHLDNPIMAGIYAATALTGAHFITKLGARGAYGPTAVKYEGSKALSRANTLYALMTYSTWERVSRRLWPQTGSKIFAYTMQYLSVEVLSVILMGILPVYFTLFVVAAIALMVIEPLFYKLHESEKKPLEMSVEEFTKRAMSGEIVQDAGIDIKLTPEAARKRDAESGVIANATFDGIGTDGQIFYYPANTMPEANPNSLISSAISSITLRSEIRETENPDLQIERILSGIKTDPSLANEANLTLAVQHLATVDMREGSELGGYDGNLQSYYESLETVSRNPKAFELMAEIGRLNPDAFSKTVWDILSTGTIADYTSSLHEGTSYSSDLENAKETAEDLLQIRLEAQKLFLRSVRDPKQLLAWESDRQDPLTPDERLRVEYLYRNLDRDPSLATAENLRLVLRDIVRVYVSDESGDGYDHNLQAVNRWSFAQAWRNEKAFAALKQMRVWNTRAFTQANKQLLEDPKSPIRHRGADRDATDFNETFDLAITEALTFFDQTKSRSEVRLTAEQEKQFQKAMKDLQPRWADDISLFGFIGFGASRRAAAAKTLGDLKDIRAVPALIDALEDWTPEVRESARKALNAISPQGLAQLKRYFSWVAAQSGDYDPLNEEDINFIVEQLNRNAIVEASYQKTSEKKHTESVGKVAPGYGFFVKFASQEPFVDQEAKLVVTINRAPGSASSNIQSRSEVREFVVLAEKAFGNRWISADALTNIRSWSGLEYARVHGRLDEEFKAAGEDPKTWSKINDAWYTKVAVGTAGMRGTLGLGTNRISEYTIGSLMMAHALSVNDPAYTKIIEENYPGFLAKGLNRAVVIGGDSRYGSYDVKTKKPGRHIKLEALINAALGIKAYVFKSPTSTPQLAWAVHELDVEPTDLLVSGSMNTASHNPLTDNGNKPYKIDGSQSTGVFSDLMKKHVPEANVVALNALKYRGMNILENLDGAFEWALVNGDIRLVGGTEDDSYAHDSYHADELFVQRELQEAIHVINGVFDNAKIDLKNSKIVISPLYGVARHILKKIVKARGLSEDQIIWIEDEPNSDFPGVEGGKPNPEEPKARLAALRKAVEVNADLVLWTDPDADRPAVATKKDLKKTAVSIDDYVSFNGNQQLAILMDYLVRELKALAAEESLADDVTRTHLARRAVAIMANIGNVFSAFSLVSADLPKIIARANGLNVVETLVGFKYIGDQIELRSKTIQKLAGVTETEWQGLSNIRKIELGLEYSEAFLFGGEESLGALSSDGPHDKDALAGVMWFVEIMGRLHKDGKTLQDRLTEIYKTYGYFSERFPMLEKSKQYAGVNFSEAEAMQVIKAAEGPSIMNFFRTTPPRMIAGKKVIAILDMQAQVAKDPDGNLLFDMEHQSGLITPRTDGIPQSFREALSRIPVSKTINTAMSYLLQGIYSFRHRLVRGSQVATETLPKEAFIRLLLEDGSIVTPRPSGTEPKVKFYILGRGLYENKESVDAWVEAAAKELDVLANNIARQRFPEKFVSRSEARKIIKVLSGIRTEVARFFKPLLGSLAVFATAWAIATVVDAIGIFSNTIVWGLYTAAALTGAHFLANFTTRWLVQEDYDPAAVEYQGIKTLLKANTLYALVTRKIRQAASENKVLANVAQYLFVTSLSLNIVLLPLPLYVTCFVISVIAAMLIEPIFYDIREPEKTPIEPLKGASAETKTTMPPPRSEVRNAGEVADAVLAVVGRLSEQLSLFGTTLTLNVVFDPAVTTSGKDEKITITEKAYETTELKNLLLQKMKPVLTPETGARYTVAMGKEGFSFKSDSNTLHLTVEISRSEVRLTDAQEKQFQKAMRDLQPRWADDISLFGFVGFGASRRAAAAETLGKLKDTRAVPALIDALEDWTPEVRESARKALNMISPQGLSQLKRYFDWVVARSGDYDLLSEEDINFIVEQLNRGAIVEASYQKTSEKKHTEPVKKIAPGYGFFVKFASQEPFVDQEAKLIVTINKTPGRSEMRPPFKGLYLFSGRQLSKYPVIQTAVRITKILRHSLAVFFEAFWKIFEIPFVIFLAVVGPVFYGVTAFLITSDTIE
ncbi:MAG: hypothetical protein WC484_03260, partial [Candidatus Omnitrophota bacterium]